MPQMQGCHIRTGNITKAKITYGTPHINRRRRLQHPPLFNEQITKAETKWENNEINSHHDSNGCNMCTEYFIQTQKNIASSQKFKEPSPKLTIYSVIKQALTDRKRWK